MTPSPYLTEAARRAAASVAPPLRLAALRFRFLVCMCSDNEEEWEIVALRNKDALVSAIAGGSDPRVVVEIEHDIPPRDISADIAAEAFALMVADGFDQDNDSMPPFIWRHLTETDCHDAIQNRAEGEAHERFLRSLEKTGRV